MTLADLIATVRQRMLDDAIPARDIEAEGEAALTTLAEEVATGPHARDLEEERTLTLTAGKVAIPTDFLSGYIRRIAQAALTPPELVIVYDRAEFTYSFSREFAMAAVEAGSIYTQAQDTPATPLTGDILVTSIVIPTLAGLKLKFEKQFIGLVINGLKANSVVPKKARA